MSIEPNPHSHHVTSRANSPYLLNLQSSLRKQIFKGTSAKRTSLFLVLVSLLGSTRGSTSRLILFTLFLWLSIQSPSLMSRVCIKNEIEIENRWLNGFHCCISLISRGEMARIGLKIVNGKTFLLYFRLLIIIYHRHGIFFAFTCWALCMCW